MQSNEETFQVFFLRNPRPMAVCDPREERCLLVNEALAALHEYTVDEATALRPCLLAGRVRTKTGRWLWVESEAREIVYEGRAARLMAYDDVTERRATEEAERSYRGIFENALDGIFQTTPDGSYLRVNTALARIYGYESPEDLSDSLRDVARQLYVEPGRRDEFIRLMAERDAVSGFEAQIYRKDGGTTWIVEHARAVRDVDGRLLYYEGTVQDIAERKALEAERERLLAEALERADHDPLTGLLNHRAFHKRYEEEAERAARLGTTLGVAMLDLDNFKFFNDSYGHAVGDEVLRRVAETLRQGCRRYDVLARFGGDEFALLMPETSPTEAARLAERLERNLERSGYRPEGSEVPIPLTLSLGLASFPLDGAERQDVLAAADSRLIWTKTGGSEEDSLEGLRSLLSDSFHGFSMLDALVTAVDNKDRYTRRHSEDVMIYSVEIARALGLAEKTLHTVRVAALLHDVGKIGVPDRILRKPGGLTDEEFEAIKQHPAMGAAIVGATPGFEDTLDAIRHHHECWDGGGYPFGLRGEETPLLARLMAVADAYSAMTMDRPYRKGKLPEDALAVLSEGAGRQWDSVCVRAFLSIPRVIGAAPRFSAGEKSPSDIFTSEDPELIPRALLAA